MKRMIVFLLASVLCQALPVTEKFSTRSYQIEVLSWNPRIFVFRDFLNDEECNHLMKIAVKDLKRARVVAVDSEDAGLSENRTSEGTFLPVNLKDPIVQSIEDRIAEVTLIPKENGESMNILRYSLGGEYKPHYDYFDESSVGGAHGVKRGGQRIASFLMYLNTPEEGGATIFPLLNIQVQPKKGDALLFYDFDLYGKPDTQTLHGGAPVTKGEKWLATKWLRQSAFK